MPTRWQREFTCDVCAGREFHCAGELRTHGRLGWSLQWRICDTCLDRLFNWRGQLRHEDLFREDRERPGGPWAF